MSAWVRRTIGVMEGWVLQPRDSVCLAVGRNDDDVWWWRFDLCGEPHGAGNALCRADAMAAAAAAAVAHLESELAALREAK